MIHDTATLLGVDDNMIKEAYEFMLLTWFLKIVKNDKKLITINIPYLGNLGLRLNDDILVDSKDMSQSIDIDCFVSLNETFKKMIYDVKMNKSTIISEFIQNKMINRIIDNNKD